ncbi:MAG: serine/threonine protein kinase, partial [Nannocystaceae bacterium]
SVFFAMEMLEGQDLGGLLELERRLPWTRARRIFLQITRALEAAHSHGVIHRDIKPENCFVLQRPGKVDFVKVLDFGIAKVVDEERKNAHTLTQAGALIGTPEYMAPEQVQGGAADRRMDIYSVGCIMYQALTGELPFEDATMFGVLTKQVSEDPVPLQERAPDAEIPQAVADVVLRAMAKSFDDRYQTMAELAEAIENLGENPLAAASATAVAGQSEASTSEFAASSVLPVQQQTLQRAVVGLGVVVVLLCGLLVYFAMGSEPGESSETADVPRENVAAMNVEASASSGDETTATTADETDSESDSDSDSDSEPTGETDSSETTDATTGDAKDSNSGSEAGSSTGSAASKTKKKRPGKKKALAPDPNLPKELDLFGRDSGIRSVREAVKKCRGVGGAAAGTQVKVTIKVSGRTGKVLSANPSSGGAAGQCVAKAVKKAKFPRFQKSTQKFTQAFRL